MQKERARRRQPIALVRGGVLATTPLSSLQPSCWKHSHHSIVTQHHTPRPSQDPFVAPRKSAARRGGGTTGAQLPSWGVCKRCKCRAPAPPTQTTQQPQTHRSSQTPATSCVLRCRLSGTPPPDPPQKSLEAPPARRGMRVYETCRHTLPAWRVLSGQALPRHAHSHLLGGKSINQSVTARRAAGGTRCAAAVQSIHGCPRASDYQLR